MDSEAIMASVIISITALVMLIIGACQYVRKDNPVGFYNVTAPPKKEEISDIIQWNMKHGMIWIIYGVCIELGFWLGYAIPSETLEVIFMIGGIILPLPFMVMRHQSLEKQYKIRKSE